MLGILVVLLGALLWSRQPSLIGQLLRRWLIERPAARLSQLKFGHLAFALIAIIALVGAFHAFEIEGVRLVGAAFGEAAAWYIAFDIGTLIEVFAVVWLLRTARPARLALGMARAIIVRTARRIRRIFRRPGRRASCGGRRDAHRGRRDDDPNPAGIGRRRAGRRRAMPARRSRGLVIRRAVRPANPPARPGEPVPVSLRIGDRHAG